MPGYTEFTAPVNETGVVYVTLTSGEVIELSPATTVSVDPDLIVVFNGYEPVASYPRASVFSCTKSPTSPAFT